MDCPYCAEQIKDTALVCAHCGRDLTFFRPVMTRLDALETRIASLEGSAESRRSVFVAGSSSRAGYLAAVLTALIAVASYAASLPEATSPPLLLLSIFCPLPIGVAVGFITTHTSVSEQGWGMTVQLGVIRYFLFGLIAGFLTFGSMSLLLWSRHERVITSDFWPAASLWVLGSAVLFAGGGFVGRWLRKRKVYEKNSWSVRVANRLVDAGRLAPRTSVDRDAQVKRLAQILTALAPILTLVGTIITGVFTYLANKKQ